MATVLTDWYPNAEVKPVREGWYHIKWEYGVESMFNWYWTGEEWRNTEKLGGLTYLHTPHPQYLRILQSRPFFWRGQTHA